MKFKTETRHNTWHVKIYHGDYSDYREQHLYFSANSQEETFHYLKGYAEKTREFFNYVDKEAPMLLKSEELGFISIPATKDYWDREEAGKHKPVDEFGEYTDWHIEIKPLNVIITR